MNGVASLMLGNTPTRREAEGAAPYAPESGEPLLSVPPHSLSVAMTGVEGLHASDIYREITPEERLDLAYADLRLNGNVWLITDHHRGKGLLSTSLDLDNARECERNIRDSVTVLTSNLSTTQGALLMGDMSDSSLAYETRKAIVINTVRQYSEALECATSKRWLGVVLGNHEIKRAEHLDFVVQGEPRRIPLQGGRLIPRRDLENIKDALGLQNISGDSGVAIDPRALPE